MKTKQFIMLIMTVLLTVQCNLSIKKNNYSRDELIEIFNSNEDEFEQLVAYFQSINSNNNLDQYQISFGIKEDKQYVSINILPYLIDSLVSKDLGGDNLLIGSIAYNDVLKKLNWNNDDIKFLQEKLIKTNCDVIRSVDYYGGAMFEIFPYQDGFHSYSFIVYENSLNINRKTISNTKFGKRVRLVYSNSL